MSETINRVSAKFASGNSVPVDSVRITADEWSDVKAEIEKLQLSLADYEETNEKYLARIVWFDGQLAASRRELVGASKSARAQARIIESLQQQRAHLHAQRDQWVEACDTLDSERAANARLTAELAASREREARMRGAAMLLRGRLLLENPNAVTDDADAALAEGAQG